MGDLLHQCEGGLDSVSIALETSTMGTTDTCRNQFLIRFVKCAISFAKLLHSHGAAGKWAFNRDLLGQFKNFSIAKCSFQEWMKAASEHFVAMDAGWGASTCAAKEPLSLFDRLLAHLATLWDAELCGLADELAKFSPAQSLVENPSILKDSARLKTLESKCASLAKCPALHLSSERLALAKELEASISAFQKLPGRSTLSKRRRFAKLAIGVEYAVTEIHTLDVESSADIPTLAKRIAEKLKGKGMGGANQIPLPAYLSKVLAAMAKTVLPAEVPAAPTPPSEVPATTT